MSVAARLLERLLQKVPLKLKLQLLTACQRVSRGL